MIHCPHTRHGQCLAVLLALSAGCESLDDPADEPAAASAGSGATATAGGAANAASDDDPEQSGPPRVSVDEEGETTPDRAFTDCASHADCGLVRAGCTGCCQQDAVRRELVPEYTEALEAACLEADTDGPICRCLFDDMVARCEDEVCKAVPRADFAATCFSPTRPTAQIDRGVGCACDIEGQQICAGGAYGCEPDGLGNGLAWRSIVDGPCWPRPDACPDGTIVETIDDCLADFRDCYRREDRSFCGIDPL